MSMRVRSVQGYAIGKVQSPVRIREVRAYALVSNRVSLPGGKSGLEAVKDLISTVILAPLTLTDIVVSAPVESTDKPEKNTKVGVTTVPGAAHPYRGTQNLYYNRIGLADLLTSDLVGQISLDGFTNVHQLIPQLNTLTGLVFSTIDLVDSSISGGHATITAASTSYFFTPGGSVSK